MCVAPKKSIRRGLRGGVFVGGNVVVNNSSFRKARTPTERFPLSANIGIDLESYGFQKYPVSAPSNYVRTNHSSDWSEFWLATATLHMDELETNACLFVIPHAKIQG